MIGFGPITVFPIVPVNLTLTFWFGLLAIFFAFEASTIFLSGSSNLIFKKFPPKERPEESTKRSDFVDVCVN